MKLGFIGLGKMGGGMCKSLLRKTSDVSVFDLNPDAVNTFAALGAIPAATAREAAAGMDAVITSLPMPSDLEKLLLGQDGIYAVMQKNAILIDISTLDPKSARRMADAAEEKDLGFLSCPLGKGPAQAECGEAPIFAGGREEIFEICKATLKLMSDSVTYMGDVEQATAFKLITNLMGMANVNIMAEGVKLAQKMGIEPDMFMNSCMNTGATSYQFAIRAPWIFNGDFSPRFSVNLALKDVRLGVGMAREAGISCPSFSEALATYEEASARGLGDEDCAAVYKLL